MPYGSTARFVHQEVRGVPTGFKVRTVKAGTHQVRVAFPPGPRRKGSGIVVGVLHPRGENSCPVARKNPAELLLMGANPSRRGEGMRDDRGRGTGVYDSLPPDERLAFGRLGIGRAQIQTKSDLTKARHMVAETQRLRNRLPNPAADLDSPAADQARDLREGFSGEPSEHYEVRDEPHVPVGDYTDCGEFIAVAVKPEPPGEAQSVQEISFPGRDLELICDHAGKQLYIVGVGQDLSEADIRVFTSSDAQRVELGEALAISYGMAKFGGEVPPSARGEDARWDHRFGEEGGTCPRIEYDRKIRRLIIGRATYRIEGAWIRN